MGSLFPTKAFQEESAEPLPNSLLFLGCNHYKRRARGGLVASRLGIPRAMGIVCLRLECEFIFSRDKKEEQL
jgi:hypothetical protein